MSDFIDIKHDIDNYLKNKLSIMKEKRPNLGAFWENYLNQYINRLDVLIQQIHNINTNEYINEDLSFEQILLLYRTMNPI